MTTLPSFPALLEHFFTQRLMQQRRASPHTISSYRDTFRQFLKFAEPCDQDNLRNLVLNTPDSSAHKTLIASIEIAQQHTNPKNRKRALAAEAGG